MFEARQYTPAMADEWNRFVARSKNATFLHDRRYMDYHADRFADHSLLVFRGQRLYALLPGNTSNGTFYSHQGLTYGGLLTDGQATADGVCEAFLAVNDALRAGGIHHVVYKPVPHIFHRQPAEEDLYALFLRCGARLTERDVSATIDLACRPRFAESRRSGLRKALREGLQVQESRNITAFWQVLVENLRQKYDARPVHTVDEISLLMARFPDSIRLFLVTDSQEHILGGTLLYLSAQVVHTQYISASAEGKRLGAVDLLFDRLLSMAWGSRRYFDFGTSAQDDCCELKLPLFFQKCGFGARSVCYDTYAYDL